MTKFPILAASLLASFAVPAFAQNENPYPPPIAYPQARCERGYVSGTQVGDAGVINGVLAGSTLRCGHGAVANEPGATALGYDAVADAAEATAVGYQAWARAQFASTFGANATASQQSSTALGAGAIAAHAGSTALGARAQTTATNQVALGATGTSVRVGDIAASTSAQVGPVALATVDAFGTLGRNTTIMPAIQALQSASSGQAAQLAGLQAAQSLVEGRVDTLFDLRESDREDTRQGIAAAIAMGHAAMPSEPGRTSYALNVATFRGEQALGGSIMHRLNTENPTAISVGLSYAGNRNNAARVGVAGEF